MHDAHRRLAHGGGCGGDGGVYWLNVRLQHEVVSQGRRWCVRDVMVWLNAQQDTQALSPLLFGARGLSGDGVSAARMAGHEGRIRRHVTSQLHTKQVVIKRGQGYALRLPSPPWLSLLFAAPAQHTSPALGVVP